MKHFILILILALASLVAVANAKKVVNCYYGPWMKYRDGKYDPSKIDTKLCTYISLMYFGIETSGRFTVLDEYRPYEYGSNFKQANRDLKLMAVVGGKNEASSKYSSMAASLIKRGIFVTSAVTFLTTNGFDGMDLDWQFPVQGVGSSAKDKQNFVTLLKELRVAFKLANLQLSITAGAAESLASQSYDIANISKQVDFINLMSYDFNEAGKLSFNAPQRGQGENNVEDSTKYWLAQGAPAGKLLLGLPFFGRHFQYAQQPTAGSPNTGLGTPGPLTGEAGLLGYNEICTLIKSSFEYTTKFDESHGVPYAYNDKQWVGYDNVRSIEEKVQLANRLELAGVMARSVEMDDFRGTCGESFPLLHAINRQMSNTTSANDCVRSGYTAHKSDCQKFIFCDVNLLPVEFICGPGLMFDTLLGMCNLAALVNCQKV